MRLGQLLLASGSVVLFTLGACSDDNSSAPAADHGRQADAALLDRAIPDQHSAARDALDGAGAADTGDDRGSTDSGLASSCTGTCAQQTLSASFGTASEPFERSIYGIDRDQQQNPGIYLEALHGGFAGCPDESSPTPDRSLIISGLPLPQSGPPLTLEDGLVISLLDYQGTLLPGTVLSKATAASVTFVAGAVCPSCAGQPAPADPAGFVALELTATFAEGTVSGHLYASHCDSLNL